MSKPKLIKSQVLDIYSSTESTSELSRIYQVSPKTILSIKRRMSYLSILSDISELPGVSKTTRKPLTVDQVIEIYKFSGTPSEFKKEFGIGINVVRNIKNRITYSSLTQNFSSPGQLILYGLSWIDVSDIRKSKTNVYEVAEKYDVTKETVYNIRNNQTRFWK